MALARWFAAVCLLGLLSSALARESFVVEDIRVEGLRRISVGAVFNDLPFAVGDSISREEVAGAIKALFDTGLFDDVRIRQEDGILVVTVEERPSIASVDFSGNRVIKTEDLEESLEQAGFVAGRIFDPAAFDRTMQDLRSSYFSRGRYSARIDATVTPLERNRVAVRFDIEEGDIARIRRINVVGNRAFEEDELLDLFESSTRTLFSWLTGSDRYSKETLTGDLERLRTFYLDRGHINFVIASTQVSITPDRRFIHITINIDEGKRFRVESVDLAGNLVVDPDELIPLVTVRGGDLFNRGEVAETAAEIKRRLGDEGYAFAEVNPVPDIDDAAGSVGLTFFVDPGRRVYVRRVVFRGNRETRDEVLRRELRQLEGAWVVNRDLERSRTRLLRLGFFDDVRIETEPVPAMPDRVDVIVHVTERPTGTLLAGVGYAEDRGALVNLSVTKENVFGQGSSVSLTLNNSQSAEEYSLSYFNPYITPEGISRRFDLRYKETDGADSNIADYFTDVARAEVRYGIPINEYDRVHFGFAAEAIDFMPGSSPSEELASFERETGGSYQELLASVRWSRDSRNRRFLSTRGSYTSALAEAAVPGSDLTYYRLRLSHQQFFPLTEKWTLMAEEELGYGDGYADTSTLPLTSHFFAGGASSVRGYEARSLGPRDSNGEPIGGDLLVLGRLELIVPLPFLEQASSFRLTGFLDAGNVFRGASDFDADEVRLSAGFSTVWFAGIGVITTSWGFPLNEKAGDELQAFQFTIGATF